MLRDWRSRMFALVSNTQFQPAPPRLLTSATYADDFNAVKALGRSTGSTRTADQTALAVVLGRQRQRPLEPGREPDRARQPPVHVRSNRLLAVLNIAMADTAITTWSAQAILRYRSDRSDVAASDLDSAGGHRRQSGHGCRSRLAAAHQYAVASGISGRASQPERSGCDGSPQPLRRRADVYVDDGRTAEPHVRQHRPGALGREQRPGLGRNALPQHCRDQRRAGRGNRRYVNQNSMQQRRGQR